MAGERGKTHCHCLGCAITYKLNHMGHAETLEIRLLGPKLLLGMGWRPSSLKADFKSQFGICACSLVPTGILKPLKSCSSQLTEKISLPFLATQHIFDQGPNDRELAYEQCELSGYLPKRVALASSAVCSSAPLSCKVCVQSVWLPTCSNQCKVSSSKRL